MTSPLPVLTSLAGPSRASVQFASEHSLDTNGRVFFSEGRVYRGINSEIAPLYSELLTTAGAAERLFAAGLVRTWIVPGNDVGYDLVLEHERVWPVSCASEWCGSMLKDAALLTLDLSFALDEHGLELVDAHPWNVLFDGTRPKFIDFTSIVSVGEHSQWRPFEEFVGTFLNPLVLMSHGLAPEARRLLVDSKTFRGRKVTASDLRRALLRNKRFVALAKTELRKRPRGKAGRQATLVELRRLVEATEIRSDATRWSSYCAEELDFCDAKNWMTKRQTCYDVLRRTQPQTVLDIGSNTGWFSKLAASTGSRVVAFDMDEVSINGLYKAAGAKQLPITPLAMDFCRPTPAYGLSLRFGPAAERFRSELVLALAIVHHLVFSQKQTFDNIAVNLAQYSTRYLLVEFIPREDVHVARMYNRAFSWYTLDNFVAALRKHFASIEILPSNPNPRVLLLCRV